MVFDIHHPAEAIKAQRRTALLVSMFGSIPLSIGIKLRRFFYRSVLGQMGAEVSLDPGLELIGAGNVHLGDRTSISNNVCLNSWDIGSKILIHDRVRLDRGIYLQSLGGCIEIGEMTYIGPYFCAAGPGNITIGKNCLIASHSSAYANSHIFSDPHASIASQGVTCKGIVIEDDCWLGTGVRVLDGVTIGQGSVIGAGAVVTKNIPPYSVAVGAPAKVIRQRQSADGISTIAPEKIVLQSLSTGSSS